MRTAFSIVSLALSLALLAGAGCSSYLVPQDDYDRIVSDLGASRSQADRLQVELAKAQSENKALQTDLASVKGELSSVKPELATTETKLKQVQGEVDGAKAERDKARDDMAAAQSETTGLQRRLAKIRLYSEIINGVFVPTITGEAAQMSPAQKLQVFVSWQTKVDASGDPQLQQKFKALVGSNAADPQLKDFFLYLFKAIPTT
jgi:hypothetical protein